MAPPAAKTCPQIHIFGAHETTAPPGFGTAQTMVDLVIRAFPGTSEAIDYYPAAPDDAYASSVTAGIAAVVKQTSAFTAKYPDTIIVMHGYSQVYRSGRPPVESGHMATR